MSGEKQGDGKALILGEVNIQGVSQSPSNVLALYPNSNAM